MDFVAHFRRETLAFEAAARRVSGTAPIVPSCPEWSMSDLVAHLGWVHRLVADIIISRLQSPPDTTDRTLLKLPGNIEGWPIPESTPNLGPVPANMVDWFADGASVLASLFTDRDPGEPVWTWSQEHTVGFWLRMQAIEAAVHRWDAENTIGTAQPIEAALAGDAIGQNFTVMAPARRARHNAPPGSGERFQFRQTDGTHSWTVRFEGSEVQFTETAGPCDVELAGTASDLMLFLWHRIPVGRLSVSGDLGVLDRYFTLVPPA